MNHKLFSPMRGFSMLEVLVALLVISVGLLGVATLQTKGQQFNYFSYIRTQSTYLAYDLMERIRTNMDAAEKGHYKGHYDLEHGSSVTPCPDDGKPPDSECEEGVCNSDRLAQYDLANWLCLVRNTLPEGSAEVEPLEPLGSGYKIILKWSQGEERKKQESVIKL